MEIVILFITNKFEIMMEVIDEKNLEINYENKKIEHLVVDN